MLCMKNKPPESFRDVPTFPSAEDIHFAKKPFLRPLKKIGCYDNDEHYLDVQYRLLREDFLSTLRDGIQEVIQEIPNSLREHALKVYKGVRILHMNLTENGFSYRIMFQMTHSESAVWKCEKQFIFGSLVCLSKDKFQTMIFATVVDPSLENLKAGLLDICFSERMLARTYCEKNQPMVMVATPTYFEAYKHVLDGMKEMKSVPMHKYIVKCKPDVGTPHYLSTESDVFYDLSCIQKLDTDERYEYSLTNVPIIKKYQWPRFEHTSLNKSQIKAFMHALTEEFTLIQGPPGTGKTYLGLHIADALLRNKTYWKAEEQVPILVVCFTNHALDQFLKGLIYFGHENVIRVGGRGCEELKFFNLKSAIKDGRYGICSKRIQEAKYSSYQDKERNSNELRPYVDGLKTLYENMITGCILYDDLLINLMPRNHVKHLSEWGSQLNYLGVPLFDVFLGLCKVSPKQLKVVELDVDNEKTVDEESNEAEDGDMNRQINDILTNFEIPCKMYNLKGSTAYSCENVAILDESSCQLIQPNNEERKRIIKESLKFEEMSEEEALNVIDPWQLDFKGRWRLYKYWVKLFALHYASFIEEKTEAYENACEVYNGICQQEEELILKQADVIAMTTTCAAKYRDCLQSIKPKIVIIEEAAEVLEAHVITSLSDGLEHLILVGDHKQLKPNPAVYELAKKYSLEISLFERMINNGMTFSMLDTQHRMRPEISRLLRHVYPQLKNHPSVLKFPNVLGVEHNIMFINHEHFESHEGHIKSKSNLHEAQFLKSFCIYLLQQGYKPSQITILTGYTGQWFALKSMMPRKQFEGVRVAILDNYQGEENDIVLLSLVRSNPNGKLGFMKVENRICVALSRARVGLFVIGNFEMFEKGSPLWKKIIQDVRRMSALKDYLTLCCQNHPDMKYLVENQSDFLCIQDGGCTKPCEFRMDCGHVCELNCHPINGDHKNIPCMKPCDKTFSCGIGHKCNRTCHYGEECEICQHPVEKTLSCFHTYDIKCGEDTESFICTEKCTRVRCCGHYCTRLCGERCSDFKCEKKILKLLKCGHEMSVPCYMNVDDVLCSSKCNVILDCLHKCSGTCGKCRQGRLHVKCSFPCNRVLVCSHLCKEPCTSECPPCQLICENRCSHSKCGRKCGELCAPCIEPCLWKCKHFDCPKKCSEICDRPRCNEACNKFLKCAHKCIGLCGELCPPLCRICDKEKVAEVFFGTEGTCTARYILLHDCKHMFEVSALDKWMDNVSDGDIKLKECPKCKTPIRRSLRYANVIKRILNDIERVKDKLIASKRKATKLKSQGYKMCMEIFYHEMKLDFNDLPFSYENGFPKKDELGNETALHSLLESPVLSIRMVAILFTANNLTDVSRITNQVTIWKAIWTLRETYERYQMPHFYRMFSELENYLVQKLSLQQYEQLLKEFKRLYLHLNTFKIKQDLSKVKKPMNSMKSIDIENLSRFLELFEGGDVISEEELNQIDSKVKKISKQWDLGIYNVVEKLKIIRAIGLDKGHWFKCGNGHVYAIGECGGAMEKGICPECGRAIGGTSHVLADGNIHASDFDESHYPAYSDAANNSIRHVHFEDGM